MALVVLVLVLWLCWSLHIGLVSEVII